MIAEILQTQQIKLWGADDNTQNKSAYICTFHVKFI